MFYIQSNFFVDYVILIEIYNKFASTHKKIVFFTKLYKIFHHNLKKQPKTKILFKNRKSRPLKKRRLVFC